MKLGTLVSGCVQLFAKNDAGMFITLYDCEYNLGFIHVKHLCNGKKIKPSFVFKLGDYITCEFIGFGEKDGIPMFSLKNTHEEPFELITANYKENDYITGTVWNIGDTTMIVKIAADFNVLNGYDIWVNYRSLKNDISTYKVGQTTMMIITGIDYNKKIIQAIFSEEF